MEKDMDAEIIGASGVGLELTNLLMPFISALMILVITLWFKDFATKIAKGMAFKMNKRFNIFCFKGGASFSKVHF